MSSFPPGTQSKKNYSYKREIHLIKTVNNTHFIMCHLKMHNNRSYLFWEIQGAIPLLFGGKSEPSCAAQDRMTAPEEACWAPSGCGHWDPAAQQHWTIGQSRADFPDLSAWVSSSVRPVTVLAPQDNWGSKEDSERKGHCQLGTMDDVLAG